MYKRCITWLLLWATAQAQDRVPGIPSIPADGVPLAQVFDSQVTDPSEYLRHDNKVYFVWGARSPQQPQGVTAARYFPSLRNPERQLTIEWYKAHHPDWIMYQNDRTTPAYGFIYSYGGLAPLDISNPAVRNFYLDTFILPAIKQGYTMVAMDNVDLANHPGSAGHFSNGRWVQLYTGKKDDTAFHSAVIGWLQFLSDHLHPLGVGVCANIKGMSAKPETIMRVMDAVDAWLDETGFTHTGKNITDDAWLKTVALLQKIAPSRPFISINQVRGPVASAAPEQIEWVIGNFLLCRGPQSLLAIVGFDTKAAYQRFDYRDEMNVNIGVPTAPARQDASGAWTRYYSRGMVLVNPSSQAGVKITLPPGKWKTIGGASIGQEMTLPPASAAVLNKE